MAQSGFNLPQPLVMGNNMKENFKRLKQQVEIYFGATGTVKKPMKTQVARPLSLMGNEALAIYNTLEVSNEDDVTVNKIFQALEEYCEPRKNLALEHFHFFKRKQREVKPITLNPGIQNLKVIE